MTKLLVLCGIQGSGKTTLARNISVAYNATVCDCDYFWRKYYGKPTCEIRALIIDTIYKSLLENNIVVDGVYTAESSRRKLLKAIEPIACEKVIIVLNTPLEECIKRNAARKENRVPESYIRSTYRYYQPPTLEEGWDEILYY